jgi:hypothetical protein
MNRVKRLVMVVAVAVTASGFSVAEEQPDLQKMASEMRKNQEAIRQYAWESKIRFEIDGVKKREDLVRVRYDMNGFMEKVQVSSEVDGAKVRGADGKKLSKKEREAAHAFVYEARRQLDNYLNPLFAEKAVATAVASADDRHLYLKSSDVVKDGDSVEIRILKATMQPLTAAVKTAVEGSPVELEVAFGVIEYGPFITKRSVTKTMWNGLELAIITENFNHTK